MNPCPEMNRRSFLQTTALGAVAAAGAAGWPGFPQDRPRLPNVVILYADDLGYGDVGCYGAADIPTPHLDALAASGSRFTTWYASAPVCSPSRASLLTGRYPQRTGVANNVEAGYRSLGLRPGEITLADALKSLGLRTGIMGKWHLGGAPECRPHRRGFDEFFGFLNGCVDYYSHIFYWGVKGTIDPMHDLWRNDEEVWANGQFLHDLIIQNAMRFIRENRDQPFFLYVPFNAPHYPMHAPPEYGERVRHIPDPHRRIQAAMVAVLDEGVGRILAALQENGLRENTLVFFLSDNGPSRESRNLLDDSRETYRGGSAGPFRGGKGGLFEGGIRVPALISWPGVIPSGRVITETASTLDVFPTVLHWLGGNWLLDRKIDGKNIHSVIMDQRQTPHDILFWGLGRQRAARWGKWKLILDPQFDFSQKSSEPLHLYDLESDPGETTNLAGLHPDIVADLKQRLTEWEAEWKEEAQR